MYRDISKPMCCTCLSEDRSLFQLYKVPDGVNLLFMLLRCDSEAYEDGFYKEPTSWLVCWECRAIIKKIKQFQLQTCKAVKHFKGIADGRNKEMVIQTLSHLSTHSNPATIIETDIFIDCNIKKENTEDYTLNCSDDYYDDVIESSINQNEDIEKKLDITKKPTKETEIDKFKEFYTVTVMDNEELNKVKNKRKLELKNEFKCDSCVLGFDCASDFNDHNLELHNKKEYHTLCVICLAYIKDDMIDSHTHRHYSSYVCKICDHTVYETTQIVAHVKEMHRESIGKKKSRLKKGLKPDVPVKYPCSECDMTFDNKGAKWKHVQKCHRAGHKCGTCQKVFTFKHNLQRHELIHAEGAPRVPCPQCQAPVRAGQLAAHARTHAARARAACAPCGRTFLCRATYETHLKYARAHSAQDVLRHACASCDKRFRSRGELSDHVAYRHDAQPRHKCPICDKSLATRRCVRRHVRRAHDGIKENARDKMCDYCGKAFRDKNTLMEHVWRHTGERPLKCTSCPRTFRQRAALHAHGKRAHPAPH